jgi:hypothetical protein
MKTKVIDIRKHDPEKVVAYWVSQGGNDEGFGRDKKCCPYVGINPTNHISGWDKLYTNLQELIDLPEEEFKTGDRVVDDADYKGTYIGFVDGIHYFILDLSTFPTMTSDIRRLKHYKEPEPFEGWVNIFHNGNAGSVYKTREVAERYAAPGARTIKVKAVKP